MWCHCLKNIFNLVHENTQISYKMNTFKCQFKSFMVHEKKLCLTIRHSLQISNMQRKNNLH